MIVMDFTTRFAVAVANRVKCQTIRQRALCKAGDPMQLFTGLGTRTTRLLAEVVCNSVRPIMLFDRQILLDGECLYDSLALADFAVRDGFESHGQLIEWFSLGYGPLPFKGYLIEWKFS